MRRATMTWLGTMAAILTMPAIAALPVGRKAPDFTTMGALNGVPFKLHLADELKKGPVVLYFYPKAFTSGCTLEAHAFSEAQAEFAKAGAQVIGVSADRLALLLRFSVEHCRGKFAVATATPAMIKAYDVRLPLVAMSNRTSYVIARDGRVAMVYSDLDYKDHVARTLAAVRLLKR